MRPATRPAAPVGRFATLVVAGLVVLTTATPAAADDDWREMLERAVREGQQRAFEGRLVVVSLDPGAPGIGEVTVTQDARGTIMTSRSAAWLLGRRGQRTFFGDEDSGTLLRLGAVDRTGFSVERLDEKYDVRTGERATTAVGDAEVLEVSAGGVVRERLFVDPGSGLIVRRETYLGDGRPVRLVAFTSLDLTPGDPPEMERQDTWRESDAAKTEMTSQGLDILRDVGWAAPRRLPGGFEIVDASALGDDDVSSLQVLYTDGLYAISVYEQPGRLDGPAARAQGARPATLGGMHVYRWPGAEPATVAWSGADRTFTAISDAPPDVLSTALRGLPADPPPGITTRLRRGLTRVAHWLWPFG